MPLALPLALTAGVAGLLYLTRQVQSAEPAQPGTPAPEPPYISNTPEPAGTKSIGYSTVDQEGAYLYASPSTDSRRLGRLHKGAKLVHGPNDVAPATADAPFGWLKVVAPGERQGYVQREMVGARTLPEQTITGTPAKSPFVPAMTTARANLRREPKVAAGNIITTLEPRTLVVITDLFKGFRPATQGAAAGWYLVNAPKGHQGYIAAHLLEFQEMQGEPVQVSGAPPRYRLR